MTVPVVPIHPDGGAALPVHAVSGASIGGPAIPVYVVSDGRPTLGQPPRRVKLITDADLTINGGNYWIEGRPFAMPVAVSTATSGDEGNVAIPIYAVNAWPGAVAAWSPTNIAGLALWLKADAGTFKDAAKAQPATADSDAVYTWADQSGNANDAIQATLGSRPLLKLNIQNGRPAILYDGSASDLDVAHAASINITGNVTMFAVIWETDRASYRHVLSKGAANLGNPYQWILNTSTGRPLWGRSGTTVFGTSAPVTSAFSILSVNVTVNAVTHYLNGAANGTGNTTNDAGGTDPLHIGVRGDGLVKAKGYHGEILIYNSALSNTNMNLVGNYLGTKWGVAWTNIPFEITRPLPYEVIQRAGATGSIPVAGTIFSGGVAHDIEASFNGGAYATIASAVTGAFAGTRAGQTNGQGTLRVRFVDDTAKLQDTALIGIGDTFVIAGQSNAAGGMTNTQAYTHASLKAALFGNDYVWKNLAGVVDSNVNQVDAVSLDANQGGSYWPLLATSYLASQSVPCAFIPCALYACSITDWLPSADHEDRTTLYGSMVHRAKQIPGGVKAVLWHQGETDANSAMSQADYRANMATLAAAIAADLGVKLIPAKIHHWSGAPSTPAAQIDAINAAIDYEWNNDANVLAGPDMSTPTEVATGLHIATDAEGADAAGRWWAALQAAFGYA